MTHFGQSSTSKKSPPTNSHQTEQPGEQGSSKCQICSADHSVFKCQLLKGKSDSERFAFIKSKDLCANCLFQHPTNSCRSQRRCHICKKKHHTLLHRKSNPVKPEGNSTNQNSTKDKVEESQTESITHLTHPKVALSTGGVLLATALITVVGENGLEVQARALIDPCSQSSFVSGSLCQRHRLKSQKVHIPIRGTGGSIIATATKSSLITVKSRVYTEFSCTVEVLIIPKVSSYAPPSMVTSLKLPHLEGLRLADPQYMCAAHIDVLLGASVYSQIIEGSVVKGRADEPIATN